jgi:hypothetical protein
MQCIENYIKDKSLTLYNTDCIQNIIIEIVFILYKGYVECGRRNMELATVNTRFVAHWGTSKQGSKNPVDPWGTLVF